MMTKGQRVPAPTQMIGNKKFRLHCTRTVIAPFVEKGKLERLGYETKLELNHGVYKLWKEVKRE